MQDKEKGRFLVYEKEKGGWIPVDELDAKTLEVMNKHQKESERINAILNEWCEYAWLAETNEFYNTNMFRCRYFMDNYEKYDSATIKNPYSAEELKEFVKKELCEKCFNCRNKFD